MIYETYKAEDGKENTCVHCGAILEDGDSIVIDESTGDVYHEECFEDNYSVCNDCGRIVDNYDLNTAHDSYGDETYVCDDCLNDNYEQCHDCGAYYRSENLYGTWDDDYICNDCRDESYYRCQGCDCEVHNDDVEWINDEPYCPNCAGSQPRAEINSYDYKPSPIFYGDNDALHMGVELEIDKGDDMNDFIEGVSGNEEIYLKHDGSLCNGVEIVSHPCTLDYHLNHFWDDIITTALDCGFRSHNARTCGLHVHLSRAYFGREQPERDFNLAKLVLIVNRFWESHIVKFSRRTQEQLDDWCMDNPLKANDDDDNAALTSKLRDKTREEGRYVNVNLQNLNTVELRFFRGTLKRQTFRAALQFTQLLADVAIQTSLNGIDALQWDTFEEMAKQRGYNDFTTYCQERDIKAAHVQPKAVIKKAPSALTNVNLRKKDPELSIGDLVRIGPCNEENIHGIPGNWERLVGHWGTVVKRLDNGYYRVDIDGYKIIFNSRYDFDRIAYMPRPAIIKTDGYWTDENGNRWNGNVYTKDEVQKIKETITNCTDCTGCTNCTDCAYCTGCTNCTDCAYCTVCTGCTDCTGCTNCTDCTGCTDCAYCTDCTGCTNCTDCTGCTDCAYCTDCTQNTTTL